MNVLVTGANGFLGQHVVSANVRRGHHVRALVRPATAVTRLDWTDQVEVVRGDLRKGNELDAALVNIDVVVHLAAATSGDDEAQFASTVVGTERLLEAMSRSSIKRLVLASTFSVYDFDLVGHTLTEASPLERSLYERDAYPIAKSWQERIVRKAAALQNWELTVLRPGFIWGPGHEFLACLGQKVGRMHLVVAPRARLPLTYVENCADCFATAVDDPRAAGRTFNVIDGDDVCTWQYLGEYLSRGGERGVRIPVPYFAWLGLTHVAKLASRVLFGGKGKLPSILVTKRFKARFKPLRYSQERLRNELGWRPLISFNEGLIRTYVGRTDISMSGSVAAHGVQHAR